MASESGSENESSPGNSYTRTFSNRGPNKRKVKPSFQSQLIQFAMFSDSEDDEDFVASSNDDDEYSTDNNEEGENERGAKESIGKPEDTKQSGASPLKVESEPENEEARDRSNTELDDESEDEDYVPVSYESEKSSDESGEPDEESDQDADKSDIVAENTTDTPSATTSTQVSTKNRKRDKLVCGICLESDSTEEDELVECDWCGITVHEGCYGDGENSVSEDKSDSDAETEPWFCDACKAKCEGSCELCPVKGGILKQTYNGRWVHLICALYVPGVGFRDVDKLQNIVIDDISSSRWSSRRCVLCEDQRFSKTGICIECDAGMCKTYFHAMCAQKHGLLTEVPAAGHLDDEDADPLFAHCKLHTDKTVLKARIKKLTIFETHVKNFKPLDDGDEKSRIENAYLRARNEYVDFRNNFPSPALQTIDYPRLLTSCPELCEKLLRKAGLMGYSTDTQEVSMNITAYVRACKPTLSCDFVNHFFKRETLVSKYQSEEKPLQQKIERSKEEQVVLQEEYSSLKLNLEDVKTKRAHLFSKATKLNNALETISGKKIVLPNCITKPKHKQRKDSDTNIDALIHTCSTCGKKEDQHLMALCDTCSNYYHIGCLDPPLLSLPKKGSKWLWQCTECDESGSGEESVQEGPSSRKRKRKTNAPQKFTPSDEKLDSKKTKGKGKGKGYGKVGRPRKFNTEPKLQEQKDLSTQNINQERSATERKPAEKPRRGRERKPQVVLSPCFLCSKEGDNKNMVKCDECFNCYHFSCCEPKLRGNPKKRGYMWFCNDCGESDGDDESSGNPDESLDEDDNSEDVAEQGDIAMNKQNEVHVAKENGICTSNTIN